MKLLSEIDLQNKKIFLRADLDVPLTSDGLEESATRLTNLRETVEYLTSAGCEILIAGHIDRPERKDPALSTKNLLPYLENILDKSILFQEEIEKPVKGLIVLLENLRFWEGEVANDLEFAKKLASGADVYVNEAFGNSHRAHASMVTLPKLLPHAAGFHLENEVNELSKLLSSSVRPFVAIVGGVKIETKIPLIENLAKTADFVLVGGKLPVEIANNDNKFSSNVIIATHTEDKKDIDKASIDRFREVIGQAKTVVWNGPMGKFEENFANGSLEIAKAIIESGAYSVVGGGETTQFLASRGLLPKFSFVSAGGGAMLEFLSGKKLPALEALE